jgi:hypothetical protein
MDIVIKEQNSIGDTAKKVWIQLQKVFPIIGFVLSVLALLSLFLPFATMIGIEEGTNPRTFSAFQYFGGMALRNLTLSGNIWVLVMMVFAVLLIAANALAFWFELSHSKALKANPDYVAPKKWYKTVVKLVLIAAPILGLIMVFFMDNQISTELTRFTSGGAYRLVAPLLLNPDYAGIGYYIYFFSFLLLVVISLVELKYRPRGLSEIMYWLFMVIGVGWIISGVIALLNGAPE